MVWWNGIEAGGTGGGCRSFRWVNRPGGFRVWIRNPESRGPMVARNRQTLFFAWIGKSGLSSTLQCFHHDFFWVGWGRGSCSPDPGFRVQDGESRSEAQGTKAGVRGFRAPVGGGRGYVRVDTMHGFCSWMGLSGWGRSVVWWNGIAARGSTCEGCQWLV